MPGHKGSRIYRENGFGEILEALMECDITEIPGADNLFQTEGIILETMHRYRELYESKESYILINGSSAGLIAAVMTTVPQGGKLVMARNCHKSILLLRKSGVGLRKIRTAARAYCRVRIIMESAAT